MRAARRAVKEGFPLKRIVLTGGGTAGHVTPNLALIPRLQRDGWDVHYIGTRTGIERSLVEPLPGVTYHAIQSGKLRRYFDLKNFTDPFRVVAGAFQAQSLLGRLRPAVVFAKGGFVSVPVVYGAALHRIPVLVHESDITPGLANKLSAPFASAVLTTFPEAARAMGRKGVCTGTPLRPELFAGDRARGLALCGFDGSKPVLMMIGGSLGAQSVNKVLREALPQLLVRYDVLHVCGRGNLAAELEGTTGYRQFEYLQEELPDAFACADLLLSRAGSNTLSEILALQKPALLVPYPASASRGDQILNARSLQSRGLAHVLMQEDLNPQSLERALDALWQARGALADAMRALPDADGTSQVVAQIERFAKDA